MYDLWALADAGRIDVEAAQLYARSGQYTSVAKFSFDEVPTGATWLDDLGHQGIIAVSPEEAARVVRDIVAAL